MSDEWVKVDTPQPGDSYGRTKWGLRYVGPALAPWTDGRVHVCQYVEADGTVGEAKAVIDPPGGWWRRVPKPEPRYRATPSGSVIAGQSGGWVVASFNPRSNSTADYHPDPERAAREEAARLNSGFYDSDDVLVRLSRVDAKAFTGMAVDHDATTALDRRIAEACRAAVETDR